MIKNLFFKGIALFVFSCNNNELSNNSQPDDNFIHVNTTEELSVNTAYQKFSGAFTGDNVKIDSVVLNMLFPNEVFSKSNAIISPMKKLYIGDFEAYVFSDNLSVYLCVFSVKNEPHLKQIEELYSTSIKDVECMPIYGSRSVGVSMKAISKKFATYDLWVIDDNGSLVKISKLKHTQVPIEEQGYFFTCHEALLGNRYYAMEHSTDIVGSLYVYDLKTKSYFETYASLAEPKYNNDTLYILQRGDYLGDTLGFAKYEKIELKLVNAILAERNVLGYMISH